MHTIKDAVEHFFYLIVGRDDISKLIASEAELRRFGATARGKKIPYQISKEQKKLADARACSVVCPEHADFTTSAFFTKTHFKSHDWKQVANTNMNLKNHFIFLLYSGCVSWHTQILFEGNAL